MTFSWIPRASSAFENAFPLKMCFTEFNEQSRESYKVVEERVSLLKLKENSKITELKERTINKVAIFMHSVI